MSADKIEGDLIFVNAAEPVFGAQIGVQLVNVHSADKCAGRPCCIHNQSDHHMKTWPQNWRGDRQLMERICPHGVGHPDPDHMWFARSLNPNTADGVHGCDGCCRGPWVNVEEGS